MALRRVMEEKDLGKGEEIQGDEHGAEENPEAQYEKQNHKFKIPKNIKMKNLITSKRNSKSEAVFRPEVVDVDFEAIECIADSPEDPEEKSQKSKIKIANKIKLPDFMKRQKNSKYPEAPSVSLDFNGNLEQNRLADAQQLLVKAEERLFGSNNLGRTEDEEDKLLRDSEIFRERLKFAILDSFNEENQETLKSALISILQEEAQDRRWAEVSENQRPIWRPTECRQKIHDPLLKTLVETRLKNADGQENKADKLSTSLKREVCRTGKQVQKDLLIVVRNLKECYPADFDICRTYAQLYHQTFSARLQELTRSSIEFEDCAYILSWIKIYYPKDVLKHKELEQHINSSLLGPLLPEEHLKRLEDQYFSCKENEVRNWLSNAFDKEVDKWSDGFEPELIEGCYFGNLAVDVLPLIEGTVKEVNALLECESKSWSLLCLLDSSLLSYGTSLKELVKRKQENIPKILRDSLVNIYVFKNYVQKVEHFFLEDTITTRMSILMDLRNICHTYFLSRIHKELKPVYRKLWTQTWFAGNSEVVEELVKAIEKISNDFKDLKPACREELLAELHVEVMVEYVRRMMKRKLKLKDKEKQEAAAEFMSQDSNEICSVFIKLGSKEDWLSKILPKLSEILKLQDPGSLQIEIATLARDYPDISEQHVLALLNLKANISSSDLRRIKGCLTDNRSPQESSTAFFSKVLVKRKII
ncbi:tumor necrosis factor alpha-induced protein 2a [Danio rerio]|uniref:Tumor necrosis factor alpha-induced protein 2a n=1 Tax=Danio rerio TaxID=7955 RepID=Q5RG40_DANRE|nr:tumor necrosis factor alpha-induced protein 2a [Danio rerio]|eukprot:NP_001025387.1 tumor necrosis factor alpha-induced protein 2 [Danio rerio]